MGWDSFGVVRFDLGPLLQGQLRIAKLKIAYNSDWCLGADNSKNKASLWRWQRELLLLSDHQQGLSTGQSGPYLKNGAEKIRWISPLHL